MKVTVKCASGPFELELADSDTVATLLKQAMDKHKCPPWADGVQLTHDRPEDLAADGTKTLASVGISGGAVVKMAYYQDVAPSKAKELKLAGITPSTSGPFLATKG
mmetsp:Transcript_74754/g.173129  ORF Transcript_74754/g.173129 Transcript_74754/m.173129 type:complete len:106 (-) Transcript_74754:63-380(-)